MMERLCHVMTVTDLHGPNTGKDYYYYYYCYFVIVVTTTTTIMLMLIAGWMDGLDT
jgi:hypothetical protein